ncbi:MAG: biotin synthase BioB [Thermodesulfobacteriota bacterium]
MNQTSLLIDHVAEKALSGEGLPQELALRLLRIEAPEDIHLLLARANQVRRRTRGDEIELCAIVNARSGRCPEDCAFCAQSARYRTDIDVYPLLAPEKIVEAARAAGEQGVSRFSVVISGKGVRPGPELDRIAEAIRGIAGLGLSPCASLGILNEESAGVLKEAGLVSYHHNLETSPDFYPRICTTHSIEERLQTARLAKATGFRLCCGGIIGLGEPPESRVKLAYALRDLGPDSVPLNFLNPIPGTPLQDQPPLPPLEILKTIALFRLVLPHVDIRTCGGRERNLRGLQPLMFLAGANATMTGNYLTTTGRSPREDVQDILDLGLKLKSRV